MHSVQYVTISMCTLDVAKTIKNVINSWKVLWSSVMNSVGPWLGYRRGAKYAGKDSEKHHAHNALNPSFVVES